MLERTDKDTKWIRKILGWIDPAREDQRYGKKKKDRSIQQKSIVDQKNGGIGRVLVSN
jgi:hypothetical protein